MESFNLAAIDKRNLKTILSGLIRFGENAIFLFFSGCLKLKRAIRLFFTGSGIGLRKMKGSIGEKVSF
jgi:hypothetical protein